MNDPVLFSPSVTLRVFAEFLDFKVNEDFEEKALFAPLSGYDDRWLHGKGRWTLEVRHKRTDEVLWACVLPKRT